MKYYIDTEFIERFHKPLFGKARHVIDLISIAIVAEDGRELHLISNEYRYKDASQWVKDNVIIPLYRETVHGFAKNHIYPENFHKHYGKSNKEIMYDIAHFLCPLDTASEYAGIGLLDDGMKAFFASNPPEFYGYYADYDWVLFCSLFGTMMDLPEGMPRYCRDLKQSVDEVLAIRNLCIGGVCIPDYKNKHEKLEVIKSLTRYPKQNDEHNALADAQWNRALHEFLQGA